MANKRKQRARLAALAQKEIAAAVRGALASENHHGGAAMGKKKLRKRAQVEDPHDALGIELAKIGKAELDAEASGGASMRQQLRKATEQAQLEYLRQVSPAAAAAWERDRPAAA